MMYIRPQADSTKPQSRWWPAPAPSGLTLGDRLPAVGAGSVSSCWPSFPLSLIHRLWASTPQGRGLARKMGSDQELGGKVFLVESLASNLHDLPCSSLYVLWVSGFGFYNLLPCSLSPYWSGSSQDILRSWQASLSLTPRVKLTICFPPALTHSLWKERFCPKRAITPRQLQDDHGSIAALTWKEGLGSWRKGPLIAPGPVGADITLSLSLKSWRASEPPLSWLLCILSLCRKQV